MNALDLDVTDVNTEAPSDLAPIPTWRLPAGHRLPGRGPRRPLEIRLAMTFPAAPLASSIDHCFLEEALRLGVRLRTPDAADAWRLCHRPPAIGAGAAQARGPLALDTLERLAEQPGPSSRPVAMLAALAAKW